MASHFKLGEVLVGGSFSQRGPFKLAVSIHAMHHGKANSVWPTIFCPMQCTTGI